MASSRTCPCRCSAASSRTPCAKISADTVDDGLIQRIVPIVLRPATTSKDAPASEAAREYTELIRRLHAMERPFDDVVLSDAAITIREKLEARHLELMAYEVVNKKLAAHIGKYDGLFARLCLLWQCIESAESGESEVRSCVTEETAQRVADFLHRFLLPHALSFYTDIFGLSDDHDRLTAVAGYILAHRLEMITNRDIQRGDRTMRNLKKRDAEDVFHQLDALGWVSCIPGWRGTDPPRWKVNSEVHRLFKDRAEQEAERRRRAREIIAASIAPSSSG